MSDIRKLWIAIAVLSAFQVSDTWILSRIIIVMEALVP